MKKIKMTVLFISLVFLASALAAESFSNRPTANSNSQKAVKKKPLVSRKTKAKAPLKIDKQLLKPQPEITRFREPADLLELVPILRDINRLIPRRFSLVNHDVTLSPNEMVIQHRFDTPRLRATPKNSILSLTYSSGLGSMETNVEVPLFYSQYIGLTRWERYPVGNYKMSITRESSSGQEVFIRAQARF